MVKQYGIFERINPGEIYEVIRSGNQIKEECPDLIWKDSYATLGRFDFIDIVEADDPKQIEKAAMVLRIYRKSVTETLVAIPSNEFLADIDNMVK